MPFWSAYRCGLVLAIVALIAGCAPRGQLTTVPPGTAPTPGATVHEIYVATTRAADTGLQVFGPDRGETTSFARFDVSIPPNHQPGEIEWPEFRPDPAQHFVVRSATRIPDSASFNARIRDAMRNGPVPRKGVDIFIHGYNSNFAEGLYRFAQGYHDFRDQGVPVYFSWASAASTVGYLYDRDSVLIARDSLATLIRELRSSGVSRISIFAHSMGTFLAMETLRQFALSGDTGALDSIDVVVLMSPDIDISLFETQVRAIGSLPQPFVVFSSRADRALQVSGRLSGDDERLGSLQNAERLRALNVTVIDVTSLSEIGSLNHATSITSPELIEFTRQFEGFNEALNSDLEQTRAPRSIQILEELQDFTLRPFRN